MLLLLSFLNTWYLISKIVFFKEWILKCNNENNSNCAVAFLFHLWEHCSVLVHAIVKIFGSCSLCARGLIIRGSK